MAGRPRRHAGYRWLLVVPFIWQVGLVPAVNGVSFSPGNIPFPMLWQMIGIVLTTAVIGVVFLMDRRRGVEDEEQRFLVHTAEPSAPVRDTDR